MLPEVQHAAGERTARIRCPGSRKSARGVGSQCSVDSIVIAADTIVVLDEMILNKPTDADDAVRMLTLLREKHIL
jgi:predicted house-cleaning NTP pyrophosphatase (Maf/HAM1 superfamily)